MSADTLNDLLDGVKRRIGVALNNADASSAWHADHLRGLQRFIIEWERRAVQNCKRPPSPLNQRLCYTHGWYETDGADECPECGAVGPEKPR